jgi:hypothetical protein
MICGKPKLAVGGLHDSRNYERVVFREELWFQAASSRIGLTFKHSSGSPPASFALVLI